MRRAVSHLTKQSLKTFSEYGFNSAGETVVPSPISPADLAGNHEYRSRRWAVDVGIANAISKPGFSQASYAGQSCGTTGHHGRSIRFPGRKYRPRNARQLISERHPGDIVVGT